MALRAWVLAGLVGMCGVRAGAQATPSASVGAALRNLASRAGDVFVGQVASIVRKGGVVEITFRAESVVQGTPAAAYVLREWAGLWPAGQQRYWVGERAMVFLRPSAPGALSTPVDGPDGVVPVLVQGAGVEPLLDVRPLAAVAVQRQVGEPLLGEQSATIPLREATAVVQAWQRPVWRDPIRRPLPVAFREPAGVRDAEVSVETVRVAKSRQGLMQAIAPTMDGGNDAR